MGHQASWTRMVRRESEYMDYWERHRWVFRFKTMKFVYEKRWEFCIKYHDELAVLGMGRGGHIRYVILKYNLSFSIQNSSFWIHSPSCGTVPTQRTGLSRQRGLTHSLGKNVEFFWNWNVWIIYWKCAVLYWNCWMFCSAGLTQGQIPTRPGAEWVDLSILWSISGWISSLLGWIWRAGILSSGRTTTTTGTPWCIA